jgi:IS605 OrfB family transposase
MLKKAKSVKCPRIEVNNQNWTLHRAGDFWTVAFPTVHDVKKFPLEVTGTPRHIDLLQQILDGTVKKQSLFLVKRRRGWCARIAVTITVEAQPIVGFVGVDRGKRYLAVASTPTGHTLFFKGGYAKSIRRHYADLRKRLQEKKLSRTIKKIGNKEQRRIRDLNHKISKQIVDLAETHHCGIRLEALNGIRQRTKQAKTTRSDAGENTAFWPFYQLEWMICYKATLRGLRVESINPAYTSQVCFVCDALGKRDGIAFHCSSCGHHDHADRNGSRNIGRVTEGKSLAPLLGVLDTPPTSVTSTGQL